MDRDSKRRTVDRFLRGMKHHRSRDEEQALREHVRRRKAEERRGKDPRRGDWDEENAETYQKIERASRMASGGRVRKRDVLAAVDVGLEGVRLGVVTGIARTLVEVRVDDECCSATLAPPLARERSCVAIGDEVEVRELDREHLQVIRVRPRRTWIGRPDPALPERTRVLAANIDLAVLVVAAARPKPRPGLVDRMLIAAGRGGARLLVCVNKIDLLQSAGELEQAASWLAPYRDNAVDVLEVSAHSGHGVEALRARLRSKRAVLIGPSGVGKSSLANALGAARSQRTGEVRAGDGKGRHTTVASSWIELGDGAVLVDTPGLRSFAVTDVSPAELAAAFPEIAEYAAKCRFGDCAHREEPDCAVRAAVAVGAISAVRLGSHQRIRGG